MAEVEAGQLIEDVDILLERDADTPYARERLNRLREELRHVAETGEWPAGPANPWGHFAKDGS